MLLPVWNHPTEVVEGAPAPQATACANSGQIAVTYVSIYPSPYIKAVIHVLGLE